MEQANLTVKMGCSHYKLTREVKRSGIQGKWLVLSCPLFGGFTGLEGNIGYQILGGALPPQSEYWGGGGISSVTTG